MDVCYKKVVRYLSCFLHHPDYCVEHGAGRWYGGRKHDGGS